MVKPRKDRNGTWIAQPTIKLTNGDDKRIFINGNTREEVIIKLRELYALENRGTPYSYKNWTVGGYLDYWMREIQEKRICETTLTAYDSIIKNHIKPTMGGHKLRNLSVHNMREALAMLDNRGCSNRVKLECVRIMSACLNCAMREELIFRNVAQLVEKPKYIPKEISIWSVEQARMFLDMNKDHPHYIALFLYIVYGMRRCEVLGLRWSDIDFDKGIIHIRQQIDRIKGKIKPRALKTKNSRREIPLKKFACAALLEHATKNNIVIPRFNPYFELSTHGTVVISEAGTPLESRNMNRIFITLVKRSGLPHATPHIMRHIAATMLKDLNVPDRDIQAILGHADITTTQKHYQHATPETQNAAISAVENLLFGQRTVLARVQTT
jgi:integrase